MPDDFVIARNPDGDSTLPGGAEAVAGLAAAGPLDRPDRTSAAIRAWAVEAGLQVSDRGRVPAPVVEALTSALEARTGGTRGGSRDGEQS